MNSEVNVLVPGNRRQVSRGRILPVAMVLFLGGLLTPASRASLIWDANLGTQLSTAAFLDQPGGVSTPSNGLQTFNLDPQYYLHFTQSNPDTVIIVTTAGFVWVGGSNTAQCCILSPESGALNRFQSDSARIAPGWADLRPDAGGSIYVNEITDALGSRTDVTWLNVATDPGNAGHVSFQMQLYTTGTIIFSYQEFASSDFVNGPNLATLIGLTPAPFLTPQSIDFTGPPTTSTSASVYDYLLTGGAGFNLSNQSIVFTPSGSNWEISAVAPTPEPATFFTAGGIILLVAFIRNKQKKRITK